MPKADGSKTAQLLCGACMQAGYLPHIDGCFTAVSYAFPWQQFINDFKFNQAVGHSKTLAQIMVQQAALLKAFLQTNITIPMPLHTSRLAERGYNQSQLLAHSLCHQAGISKSQNAVQPTYLTRIRATAVQNQLPLSQRQRNVRGAFAVPKNMRKFILKQHIALVDDVFTTGASANAAASALKDAGAKTVTVFVFARTEKT